MRGTFIRPIIHADYEQLYVAEFLHLRSSWRSRGLTVPSYSFEETVWRGIAAQVLSFSRAGKGDLEVLTGWYQLYNLELDHRVAHLGVARFGADQAGFSYGLLLFLDHVFGAFDLDQLLLEIPSYNRAMTDGWSDVLQDVACIPSRVFAHGRRWDVNVMSLKPDVFRSSDAWRMLRSESSADAGA